MRFTAFASAVLLCLSAGTAYSADASGIWQSEKSDEGKWIDVSITPCGDQICGTILKVYGSDDVSSEGKQMIKGMNKYGANRYDDGEIYAPDDKEWYDAKMELLSEDRLSVSGCVAFGLICRSQIWTRKK